jgi:tol-pal system protein YbgF
MSDTTAALLAAVFFFVSHMADVSAQASVRDSAPVTIVSATGQPSSTVTTPPGNTSANTPVSISSSPAPAAIPSTSTNVAFKIQQLQQEVLDLRGLLEEQGFELRRLKQQRLDDYLDLDKRLGELSIQVYKSSPSKPKGEAGVAEATAQGTDSVEGKDLYRQAIDQLLNQQDYPGAQAKFSQYLTQYPQGSYAPNVYYWQGQIYLAENNKAAAETALKTLVDTYPAHQKTSDAKYKLATIYFDQGKKDEAKSLLDDVAASDSDASRLAKAFLSGQYK